jgi:hypothetical protein
MTYEESNTLMSDPVFRGRIKVASLKYAGSIMIEPDNTPAHNTRLGWARRCYQQPEMVANELQPPTVMDPAVQESGSAIADDMLQPAVEGVVNKLL